MAFDKRDIREVAEELGAELTYHVGEGKPYYTGFCILHPNTKTPSFVVYPNIQRAYCYSCAPEGLDVIDLIRRKEGLSYQAALKRVTIEISDESAFLQSLSGTKTEIDFQFLQMRAVKLGERPHKLNFQFLNRMLFRFDCAMENEDYLEADHILRRAGV